MSVKKSQYSNVTIPKSLMTDISEYLESHPESGYKSVRDYVIKILEKSLLNGEDISHKSATQEITTQPEVNSQYSQMLEAVNNKLNQYHDIFALMKKEIATFTNYNDRSQEMKRNISLALAEYGRRAVGPLAKQIDRQFNQLENIEQQLISMSKEKFNRADIKKLIHEALTERQRKAKLGSARPSSRKSPSSQGG